MPIQRFGSIVIVLRFYPLRLYAKNKIGKRKEKGTGSLTDEKKM
jgi:hypothetical protein